MHVGGAWNGEYIVAPLSDFGQKSDPNDINALPGHRPGKVRTMKLTEVRYDARLKPEFPLKLAFEKARKTVEVAPGLEPEMQGASDDEEAKPIPTDKRTSQAEAHEESPDQVQYQDIDVLADEMFPDLEEMKDKVEQIGEHGRVNVEEEV